MRVFSKAFNVLLLGFVCAIGSTELCARPLISLAPIAPAFFSDGHFVTIQHDSNKIDEYRLALFNQSPSIVWTKDISSSSQPLRLINYLDQFLLLFFKNGETFIYKRNQDSFIFQNKVSLKPLQSVILHSNSKSLISVSLTGEISHFVLDKNSELNEIDHFKLGDSKFISQPIITKNGTLVFSTYLDRSILKKEFGYYIAFLQIDPIGRLELAGLENIISTPYFGPLPAPLVSQSLQLIQNQPKNPKNLLNGKKSKWVHSVYVIVERKTPVGTVYSIQKKIREIPTGYTHPVQAAIINSRLVTPKSVHFLFSKTNKLVSCTLASYEEYSVSTLVNLKKSSPLLLTVQDNSIVILTEDQKLIKIDFTSQNNSIQFHSVTIPPSHSFQKSDLVMKFDPQKTLYLITPDGPLKPFN